MRRPSSHASQSIATLIFALAAASCSRDEHGLARIVLRAPLSSATSTVVLARVSAIQEGEVQRADIASDADGATLSLRVGVPATITGTVFTFETARWRSFSSTQIITPGVGSTQLDLTLAAAPGVTGTVVPTVTVRGVPQGVLGEILPLTLQDVETGFTALTPFTTDVAIEIPAGRSIVFSVPDRFSGGEAVLPLATSSFRVDTPLPLALDATIDVGGLDVDALGQVFPSLEANGLGLECAVDGACDAGTFTTCTADGIKLATERAYTVAVRYTQVPGSCEEAHVSRDLTPPSFTTTTEPPFVQPGLATLTLQVDASESIASTGVVVTAGGDTANRCTATAASLTRVSCAVDLGGLDLASDVLLAIDVADAAGQHALRVLRVAARNGQPVQVVGIRTVPEPLSMWSYDFLVGITIAAFDGEPLCGIGPQVVSFTHATDPAASFSGTGSELWRGPNPVPAKAVGTANVATYWTRMTAFGVQRAGDYAVSASVNVPACGARGPIIAAAGADMTVVDPRPRWLTAGPMVVSPLPNAGWFEFPIANFGPDDVASSDTNILRIYTGDGTAMNAFKSGRVRVATEPSSQRTPAGTAVAEVDIDVVNPPEILAVQDGRLVRRGRASDGVTVLPSELGSTFRVFWESEREIIAVLGRNGVWLQARDGSTQTVLHPCGGEVMHSAALTASLPRHPAAAPNLALIVGAADFGPNRAHCEIDLATGAVVANIALDNAACADPDTLASDTMTGRLFAAGSGCAFLYRVVSPTTITLGADVFFDGGLPPAAAVLDSRSATALIIAAGTVYSIALNDDVLDAFPFALRRPVSGTFFPTAIAIDPVTGVPWIAGRDSIAGATVYLAYTERDSSEVAWIEAQRNDPTAQEAPNILLFDPGSNALYSSRPQGGSTASMLTIDYEHLAHNADIAGNDYPIRAWPDTLEVRDMVMAGPQPIGLSVSSAAPGQPVTVIGGGFNGGGRDEVFVHGVAARVLASTRESITFEVPPAYRAFADASRSGLSLQVGVRSSGLLSGPVPMRGSGDTFGELGVDTLQLIPIMPGQFLDVASAAATNCPATCTGTTVLVDSLGRAGVLSVRTNDPLFGVSRLEGNNPAELVDARSFIFPVRVPGIRRIIGASGSTLVDLFAPAYPYGGLGQPNAPPRERVTSLAITAVAPTPNGEAVVTSTLAGLAAYNASDLRPHAAASLAGVSGARLAVTSKGLIVATSPGLAAARILDDSFTNVSVSNDVSACPSGARGETLALVADAAGADVVLVTQYGGGVLAVEEVLDGGSGVTARCRGFGAVPTPVTTAILDLSGARLVVVSGTLATLYDTFDMRLPMESETLPLAPASGILRERDAKLFYTVPFQFFTQTIANQ